MLARRVINHNKALAVIISVASVSKKLWWREKLNACKELADFREQARQLKRPDLLLELEPWEGLPYTERQAQAHVTMEIAHQNQSDYNKERTNVCVYI